MNRFAGRPAIVTAAASGIGRAIALRLHAEGALVLAVDIDAAGLDALPHSSTLCCLRQDLTHEDVGTRIAERCLAEFGGIGILSMRRAAAAVRLSTKPAMRISNAGST
jgi:NAD(P)-dependent dehydrogenase (short-subunit alcohol dehydrogenase family)